MVFGRVNAFSHMPRNSARKLFFSGFVGSLNEGVNAVPWAGERERLRVGEHLFFYTPSGYGMCREKEEAGKNNQDFELRSS